MDLNPPSDTIQHNDSDSIDQILNHQTSTAVFTAATATTTPATSSPITTTTTTTTTPVSVAVEKPPSPSTTDTPPSSLNSIYGHTHPEELSTPPSTLSNSSTTFSLTSQRNESHSHPQLSNVCFIHPQKILCVFTCYFFFF